LEGSVFSKTDKTLEIENLPESVVSQVSVKISERAYNLFSVQEYLSLPRETRMNLVKSNGVQYLDDNGQVVPPLKAVRYLSGVLEVQRDEVNSEREIIEEMTNSKQSDFIGGMQDVLFGEEYDIVSVFPDSFVVQRPKHKVSADFFWHGKEKGYKIAVVGSCLDKDVPNAFLSALTISLLNEIVGLKKILPPEKILEYLDQKLVMALQRTGNGSPSRGVDVGVFVINEHNGKAYYSASGSRVKMLKKGVDSKVEDFKGLDIPIGQYVTSSKNFERESIPYERGDSFFIYTDGIGNQLNESGKRYTGTKIRSRISEFPQSSMIQQKKRVLEEIEQWKGKQQQTEDVLMVGIKP